MNFVRLCYILFSTGTCNYLWLSISAVQSSINDCQIKLICLVSRNVRCGYAIFLKIDQSDYRVENGCSQNLIRYHLHYAYWDENMAALAWHLPWIIRSLVFVHAYQDVLFIKVTTCKRVKIGIFLNKCIAFVHIQIHKNLLMLSQIKILQSLKYPGKMQE